ncbi:hypothetical protein H2509_04125 [Stappia sp. F7233]|uniref:Uncharacterized protein n=1 Tax=Stappia albiluteola TaxID=2758565 RepID=A0A839A9K0_9HYPH|nr:hypothetical protein [Stappia albiluteola]MBA5776300.1 hypothetical protein [Stappia albiluteola]MBA5776309.1 hypothetical protein [Stappia albiluteola]
MTAAWPASLPQESDAHSYQEAPQRAAALFEPEVGPPIGRSRSTVTLSTASFAFVMTEAQVETFEAFYRVDLARGVLPFTIEHPRRKVPVTVKLTGETPYQIASFAPGGWTVSFTALVMD